MRLWIIAISILFLFTCSMKDEELPQDKNPYAEQDKKSEEEIKKLLMLMKMINSRKLPPIPPTIKK